MSLSRVERLQRHNQQTLPRPSPRPGRQHQAGGETASEPGRGESAPDETNAAAIRPSRRQSDLHVGNPTFTSAIRPSRRLLPSREGKDLSAVNPRIVAKILDPHAWIIPIFQPLQSLKAAFCQRSSVLATADHLCFILLMGAHPRSCRRQQRADSSRIGSCLRGERTRLNASKMSRELWLTS